MNIRASLVFWAAIGISSQAISAKTFVYCSEGSPSNFNPQTVTDGPSFNANSATLFNRLVEFKQGSTEIEAGLAESWVISKDGLKYTFKLRPNVQFHTNFGFTPTRAMNADDVLFSFGRQKDPNHPYHKVGRGSYEYFASMQMGEIIKEIKKIDDMTVEFSLSQKEAPFMANMAMDFASIHSKEYGDFLLAKKAQDKMDMEPVGTGPFVFESYQKDTLIRFKSFDKYWAGQPKIDKLVFAITPDPTVRAQKLKTGECHLMAEPNPADLPALKQASQLKVLDRDGLNVGYLAFNTSKKPFDNPLVRKAILHALNRENYISAVYLGNATLAKNPIPPSMWSHNNDVVDYDYSIEKAKEFLKKAGMPNGFETELWTLPVSRPYNPAGKKMGELMQADLAKVGIKVKLLSYDWPTYLEKSRKGEHQMVQLGWTGDNGDPDNFLNILLGCASVKSGSNVSRWCHKPFNELVQQAKIVTDQKKRSDLYMKAQVVFKDQAPWATLAHGRVFRAMSTKVEGYQIHPFGRDSFAKVELKD